MIKAFILFTLLLLVIGCNHIIANTGAGFPVGEHDSISRRAEQEFHRQFRRAEDVIWSRKGDFYQASFTIDRYYVDAYYNADGDLEGYCRHIPNEQLPLSITLQLNRYFKSPVWFSNILEVWNEEGNCYWLTVITKTAARRVQVNPQGSVMQVVKIPSA